MELIHPLAEAYAELHTAASDPLAEELYQLTKETHPHAHLMSSRLQGKFLEIFSKLLAPRRILEIGTFTGYSALCLAEGLPSGGKLHTIEVRSDAASTASKYFSRSKWADRIILHEGNALEIVPRLQEAWDLAFIDADKTGYLEYYQLILPEIKSGGVILADNVFFHGEVLKDPVSGKNARAIAAFNEFVKNDERVEQVMVPVRDGLMVIRKK